jgi:sensor domain CHASE-containing protein
VSQGDYEHDRRKKDHTVRKVLIIFLAFFALVAGLLWVAAHV